MTVQELQNKLTEICKNNPEAKDYVIQVFGYYNDTQLKTPQVNTSVTCDIDDADKVFAMFFDGALKNANE